MSISLLTWFQSPPSLLCAEDGVRHSRKHGSGIAVHRAGGIYHVSGGREGGREGRGGRGEGGGGNSFVRDHQHR